jgi:hypothetical protein
VFRPATDAGNARVGKEDDEITKRIGEKVITQKGYFDPLGYILT